MKKRKQKSKRIDSFFPNELFYVIGIFAFSFILRIINLLSFPMFSDEALLLGWSKMVAENPAENLTLSIRADGYPPLTSWIYAIMFKFFSNPLFAGRFVSVLAGAFSALGVYFIGRHIFSRKTGVMAALLYIFVPMNFFIDRYAYHDSLISFFAIYTFLFSVLLIKGPLKYRPLYLLALGISMGVGILSKTAAFLILLIPPLAWVFLKGNIPRTQSIKGIKLIAVSYSFPALSYLWLFSDPHSWLIIKKGRDLSMSISELFTLPLSQWKTNLLLTGVNLWYYLTPPLLLFSVFAVYQAIKKSDKAELLLLTYFLAVLIFFLVVAKGRIHFKYLAFSFPFLLLPLASELDSLFLALKSKHQKFKTLTKFSNFLIRPAAREILGSIFLLILLLPSLQFDYFLASNPGKAKWEPTDFEIHLQSIFSGSKLNECAQFLQEESKRKTVLIILPHPDIALIYYGLPLLLESTPNLYFIRFGTGIFFYQNGEKHCLNFAQQMKPQLGGSEKLLAVMPDDQSSEWPELFLKDNPEAKLIKKFVKPGGKSSINIYQIPY